MSKSSAVIHKEKRINAISTRTNVLLLCILAVFALLCVLPVLLVVIVSFSSEQSIFRNGYTFFPTEFSLNAYRFFLRLGDQIIRSYGITLFVTIFGTLFSLAVTTMLSYVLSRPDYRYGRILTFLLLFTMLFNGGMVPSYMVNTQLLGLRDSVWALIFPMSLNAFYVLPLSKPGIATIGLFTVIAYWNDWFLGMLYIFETKKYPIQTLLQSMQNSLEALTQSSANALEYAEMAKNAPTDSGRMALTVLVVLPVMLAYPFFQKYFVKGLTVGGVKG